MGQKNYQNGFTLTLHEHVLQYPLNWKKPQVIFVNSMSDLFHEQVPFVFIEKVFKIMKAAHWHRFQVLTKRAKRLAQLHDKLEWPLNVWMGVSVEDQDFVERIDRLRETNAETKFLSLEPLLGPLPNLTLNGIDWVIVGGESGPGARKMREEWVLDILNQCKDAKVPFFFKQWGGVFKKRIGRTLENRVWNQVPDFQLNQQAP